MRRPALCTVSRGARAVCASDNAWHVGAALANVSANEVTEIRPAADGDTVDVHSSATYPFEVWALAALDHDRLLAGTRTRGVSHLRVLGSGAAHALRGRLLSVALAPKRRQALAVTSAAVVGFDVTADAIRPALRSGEDGIDSAILTAEKADVVAGGYAGERVWAARRNGEVLLDDPREVRGAQLVGHLGARKLLRVSAGAACGQRIVLASEHGDVVALDLRTDAAVQEKSAHSGWITAVADANGAIVTGGADGVVKLWSPQLQCRATLPHHADSVYGVACANGLFATVSYEGRVAVNEFAA